MRCAVLLLASILATPLLSAQRTVPSGGQWLIEPGDHPGTVQLSVRYGERGNSSNWSRDVALREFVGLSAADMRDRESRCISRSCGPEGSRTSPRVLKCRDGPGSTSRRTSRDSRRGCPARTGSLLGYGQRARGSCTLSPEWHVTPSSGRSCGSPGLPPASADPSPSPSLAQGRG